MSARVGLAETRATCCSSQALSASGQRRRKPKLDGVLLRLGRVFSLAARNHNSQAWFHSGGPLPSFTPSPNVVRSSPGLQAGAFFWLQTQRHEHPGGIGRLTRLTSLPAGLIARGQVIQSALKLATARCQQFELHSRRGRPCGAGQSAKTMVVGGGFSHGRALARGQMSLKKAVFAVLICAGYAYAAFWIVYLVHAIMLAAANY
jgi:hypothetical protein